VTAGARDRASRAQRHRVEPRLPRAGGWCPGGSGLDTGLPEVQRVE